MGFFVDTNRLQSVYQWVRNSLLNYTENFYDIINKIFDNTIGRST